MTDFIGMNEDESDMEGGLLQDSGVVGILDKMISMNAELFVSRSNGCSGRRYVESLERMSSLIKISSSRKEVDDDRSRKWKNIGQSRLKNLVDIFG